MNEQCDRVVVDLLIGIGVAREHRRDERDRVEAIIDEEWRE